MEQPTVCITGGAGFVGRSLVAVMLRNGWRVVVYDRLTYENAGSLPVGDPNYVLVVGDILNRKHLTAVLEQYTPYCVIHLAAIHYIPYCNAHVVETLQTNVAGTAAVLEACKVTEPRRFVFASTAAVYPAQDGSLDEALPAAPIDVYGFSKHFAEQLVAHYQRELDAECIIARLFNVFGPRETNPHLIPEIVQQALSDASEIRLGNLQPRRDYVYVEDVAQALYELGTMPLPEHARPLIVNIASGIVHSVADVVHELQAVSKSSFRVVQDPAKFRPSDRLHLRGDNSLLRSMLGWAPSTDLQTGLQAIFAQARQEQQVRDQSEP